MGDGAPATSAIFHFRPISRPAASESVVSITTTQRPTRRRTRGILMLAPVPLNRIHPGKRRMALGANHGLPKRTGVACRPAMAVPILLARERLDAVGAWESFTLRFFPGTPSRPPATSAVAPASLWPPGCRRWEGRRGCGRGR